MAVPARSDAKDHARHVTDGYCPFKAGKVWCNGRAGHDTRHWATFVLPDGHTRRTVEID